MGPGSVGQSEVQTEPNYWLKIPVGNKTKANRYHKWTCVITYLKREVGTAPHWNGLIQLFHVNFAAESKTPTHPIVRKNRGGVREQLWGVLVWISLWLKQQSQPNSNSHSPLDTSVGSSRGRATAAPQQPQKPQQRGTNFSVGKESNKPIFLHLADQKGPVKLYFWN